MPWRGAGALHESYFLVWITILSGPLILFRGGRFFVHMSILLVKYFGCRNMSGTVESIRSR